MAPHTRDNFGFEGEDGKLGGAPDKPKAQSSGLLAKAMVGALVFLAIGFGIGFTVAQTDPCPDTESPATASADLATPVGNPVSSGPTAPPASSNPTTPPPTETPTAAPYVPVPHTGNVIISGSTNPAVLATSYFPTVTNVTGHVNINSNPGLGTMDGGCAALRGIDGYLVFHDNDALTTLGDGFAALLEVTGNLIISDNDVLTSLGTAFRSLKRIEGFVQIYDNPLLTDFEALRNLTCHGGAMVGNEWTFCGNNGVQGGVTCPAWFIDKPQC